MQVTTGRGETEITSDGYLQNSAIWISGIRRKPLIQPPKQRPILHTTTNSRQFRRQQSRQFRRQQSRQFRQQQISHDPPIEG